MLVREMVEKDLERIQDLSLELSQKMSMLQPDFIKPGKETREELLEILHSTTSCILVAIVDDEIIGFASIHEKKLPDYDCFVPHRYAHMTDLIVTNEYQRKGIGKCLIDASKDWCKARDLDYITLNVFAENIDAENLYRKEGFFETMKELKYNLK